MQGGIPLKSNVKKLIAGSMAVAVCLLSGCVSAPDNREDPLAGYNVNALLPFPTRRPEPSATVAPTLAPESTSIISMPQGWQQESGPSGDSSTDAPTRAPSPTIFINTPSYSRLEQGDQGEEVLRLQNRLKELGYLTSSADGQFGANTKAAVKLFQKTLGLSQTGVATVSLQEKLFMSSAPVYVPSAVTPSQTASPNAGYQALVRGDRGTEVQSLQQRLIELGYLSGTADGVFGANTEKAVKRFQEQLGLSQTGVASASVQNYLYSSAAPYAPVQATAKPTARPTEQPQEDFGNQQLEPGDSGEAVVRMQNRLKQLGYFTGSVTGNYYKETTDAVKRFQAELGLSQTGIASPSLLTRLYSINAPTYSGEDAAPTEPTGGYTTLRYGSKGTEVRALQKRLIELGYMTTTADGDYGTRTQNAVKLFQKAIGYEQNGVASIGLQNLLFSDEAPVYVPTIPSAPAAPTQRPTEAPAVGYRQLQPGDTGEAVKQIQRRLKELGFFSGSIGGNYLTKTTDAVRLFQAAIGHAETGVATPEMQDILFSNDAPNYFEVENDYVDLERNDSGTQVLYLQQRLRELGYLSGKADGDYGKATESAVKAFQEQAGLPATGKASAETQEVLFSSNAPYAPVATEKPTQAPTAKPTSVPQPPEDDDYRELHYNNSGEDVRNLQQRLMELGYYEGQLGGNYLTITETAVRLFQSAIGYEANGVASPAMQTLLFSESAPYYDGTSYISLSNGDSGPAVRNLQQRLIDLSYLSGKADGDFGNGTERAIKQFQRDIGYDDDGVASVALQMILFSSDLPDNSEPDVPTVTNPPEEEDDSPRDLSYGDSGAQVKSLQQRLKELGYLTGSADGDYGKATREAVMRFQETINYYTTDGVATIELQQMIFSSDAPAYAGEEDEEEDGGDYRTLQHGNSGEDVKALQRRLRDLGYFDGDIGGNYLTKTESAVKRFQAAVGIPANGVATPAVQEMIFSSDAPSYSDSTTPPAVSPDKPDHLEVLTRGDSGSAVKTLQKRLIYLGWLIGEADGDFGEATELALNAFQYRMGLVPDGTATIETQDLLYLETAPAYVEYFDWLPGDEGEEILAMQMRLIELGYLELNENNTDGIYGASLQNALISLQLASGVEPELADGLATIELQTFLFSENAMLYAILPDWMY